MNTQRLVATLFATAAVSGVAAGAASADSVAYIKGGNVWLTTGDGSREFQVTSTGGYSAVSQADDGTLLATAGGDLRRLDRMGTVLSEIKTPVSDDPGTGLSIFYGPFNADISPDGKTAAYGYDHSGWTTGSDGYTDFEQTNGAGFTSSTALTGFTDAGYNKRLIADVVGPDRQALAVYRDQDAQPLGAVNKCFVYSGDSGTYKFEAPTFNAYGTMLYWSNGSQLDIARIGRHEHHLRRGPDLPRRNPWRDIARLGPADVPAARPTPGPVKPNPPIKTGPKPGPGGSGAKLALVALPKARLAGALRSGVAVRVATSAVGAVNVTARSGKTTAARGHVRATHAGRVIVHLTFTREARRHYRHAHRLTLALTVTQAGRHATGSRSAVSRFPV